jgi:copper resistance protein C
VPKFVVTLSVGVLIVLILGSGPAAAHASLVGTDPVDESRIATAPGEVSLNFSENVGRGFVAVTAPNGAEVRASNVRTVDQVLTADLASSDQRGRYTVAYRVVSADGHPVSGDFTFTTTTGRTVEQVDAAPNESFVHRHRSHLVVGLAIAVVAIGLILAPLRRRRRT